MKKILSLSIVAALITLMFATSVMAATQNVTFTVAEVTVDAGTATVVVPVTVSCDEYPLGISMFEGYIEAADGLTLTEISGDVSGNTSLGNGDAVVATKKAYICDDDFNDVMAEDAVVFNLTFTIDNPEVAATYAVTMSDDTYAYDEEASEEHNISIVAGSVSVKAEEPEVPTPSVNMVDAAFDTVQKADTVAGEATDYQYGSAIGVKGTTGDAIFKKMIWAITLGSDRLYSEAFDVSLAGDFEVAATFINGNKVQENNVEISNAGAIFLGEDGEDYFTNEADADNKEEKAE